MKNNVILLTTNTVLTLGHCWEFLRRIGSSMKLFKRKADKIVSRLELLAEKIINSVDTDIVEKMFLDKDYKDRTLLKIVTFYGFNLFLRSQSTTTLLDSVWHGTSTTEWEGRLDDFWTMAFLIKSNANYIKGRKIGIKQLFTNEFKVWIDELKFWFQFRFRRTSIAFFFYKDIVWALGLLISFQFINFKYLEFFKQSSFINLPTTDEQINKINENIGYYTKYNYFGTVFSFSLIYSGVCKICFNWWSKVSLPIDKWTILDVLWGIISLISFNYTGSLKPSIIMNATTKQSIDNYVALAIIISWLRFFAYLLLIRPVSVLLLTLFKMLKEIISFGFILIWYLLFVSSVFTTLFGGLAPDSYGTMSLCMRTMFDLMLANYNHQDLGKSDTSHSILLIIHLVISNVFLLNFLIAILSSVYEIMRMVGDFDYKANIYSYIEKYQIAMQDTKGYDEFVIHPCPINLITLPLIPYYAKSASQRNNEFFPKLMFWIENSVMLVTFYFYLLLLIPATFGKMIVNIVKMTENKRLLFILPMWLVCGLPYLLYISVKDASYFLKICCDSIQVEKKDTNIEALK